MKISKIVIPFFISTLAIGMTAWVAGSGLLLSPEKKFHSESERKYFAEHPEAIKNDPVHVNVPLDSNQYFLTKESCRNCHGHDSTNYANVDYNGNDVNLFDDWEATMMAMAARDPLWRAKVSHEILVNPSHSLALQDKCTSCHAPMGRYTHNFHGNGYYTMNDLDNDSLGLDGVSCSGCHTIGPMGNGVTLGNSFSGVIPYDTLRNAYGPFTNPVTGPMQLYTGYTPTYSAHMSESRACSPCHTLITNSVDLSGNFTGKKFVEQATYHEWLNSVFSADNVTCQNCHMPQITDSIRIANGYLNLPPRSPFNRHKFMGANSFMIKMIKDNKGKLGITVPDRNFDSTLAATKRNLRQNSVALKIFQDSITADTAFYRVRLINKAGHKFPSGYPSRRAVLQFVVVGNQNDTLFKSGIIDANGNTGSVLPYEDHYTIINQQTQTQVYEIVMGDVNGNRSTILERADTVLKDNRLPPEGFVSTHYSYDTIKVMGNALNDADFNLYSPGVEGSGRDYVHFHIAIAAFPQTYNVFARLYYQTLPPNFLQEMFSYSSAPIDSFKNMYNAADKAAELVDADSLLNIVLLSDASTMPVAAQVFPDPTSDGNTEIRFNYPVEISLIRVVNMNGQTLQLLKPQQKIDRIPVKLPEEKGIYILDIYTETGRVTRKVIRN